MIKTQGILSKLSTLSDRSIRLQIDLNEIPAETATEIFQNLHEYINLAIAPSEVEITVGDFPVVKGKEDKKSPSKLLRSVLFRLWEKQNAGFRDFEEYYKYKMDGIIKFYKNKLEELV